MGTKHYLEEYRFAKQVIQDYPKIINIIVKFRREIWTFRKYSSVVVLITALDDIIVSLEKTYKYYDTVVINKGEK